MGDRPDEGAELIGTCTTGEDGACSVEGVGFGDFYWYETVAPTGYVMPDDRTSSVITVDASNAGRPHRVAFANVAVEPPPEPWPGTRAPDLPTPVTCPTRVRASRFRSRQE